MNRFDRIAHRIMAKSVQLRATAMDSDGDILYATLWDTPQGVTLTLRGGPGAFGEWNWYLDRLTGRDGSPRVGDKLVLNAKQGLYVTGMRKVLAEAEKYVKQVSVVAKQASRKVSVLVDNFSNLAEEVDRLRKELLRVRNSFRDTLEAVQGDMSRTGTEPVKARKIQSIRDRVMSWFDDADGALDDIRTEADVISVTLPPDMRRYAASLNQAQENEVARLKELHDFEDYEVKDFQGHIVFTKVHGHDRAFLVRKDGKSWEL